MAFTPDAGQVVRLLVDPQAGHEQAGRRPALVISPARYNAKTGLTVCCPLTTQINGYPFEVAVSVGGQPCVVLSDQVKSLDWKARKAKKFAPIAPRPWHRFGPRSRGAVADRLRVPRIAFCRCRSRAEGHHRASRAAIASMVMTPSKVVNDLGKRLVSHLHSARSGDLDRHACQAR